MKSTSIQVSILFLPRRFENIPDKFVFFLQLIYNIEKAKNEKDKNEYNKMEAKNEF